MALTPDEEQALQQISAQLATEDPKLAANLAEPERQRRRLLVLPSAAVVLGLLIAPFAAGDLGVIGYGIALGGFVLAVWGVVTGVRRYRGDPPAAAAPPADVPPTPAALIDSEPRPQVPDPLDTVAEPTSDSTQDPVPWDWVWRWVRRAALLLAALMVVTHIMSGNPSTTGQAPTSEVPPTTYRAPDSTADPSSTVAPNIPSGPPADRTLPGR